MAIALKPQSTSKDCRYVLFFTERTKCSSHHSFQLLEDHLQKLREEDGVDLGDDDDEAMWQGWDVESDDDSDSDSEEWMNVDDDDDNDLVISDSENEGKDPKDRKSEVAEEEAPSAPRLSTLATTKVSSTLHCCPNVKVDLTFHFLDPYASGLCTS